MTVLLTADMTLVAKLLPFIQNDSHCTVCLISLNKDFDIGDCLLSGENCAELAASQHWLQEVDAYSLVFLCFRLITCL